MIVEVAILAESKVVKRIQLIDDEFKKRYTVSLEKLSICLPVSMFMYMVRFAKTSANKHLNSSTTETPLLLYAFEAFNIEDILYVLKNFIIDEEIHYNCN